MSSRSLTAEAPTAPASTHVRAPERTATRWMRRYRRLVLLLDASAVGIAAAVALLVLPNDLASVIHWSNGSVPHAMVLIVAIPAWLAVLAAGGAYDLRTLGAENEEFRRVLRAAFHLFAMLAIGAFVAKIRISRQFLAVLLPSATVLMLIGRRLGRRWLRGNRRAGRGLWNVLAVGDRAFVELFALHVHRSRSAGLEVIGACLPADAADDPDPIEIGGRRIPCIESSDGLALAAHRSGADVLAIAGSDALSPGQLKDLSWELEGSGIDLIVAPTMTELAGPRITVRPAGGLPLLYLEEPRFRGSARALKTVTDRVVAALALIVTLPLFLVIAAAIKLTSRGPVFFTQQRMGHLSRPFGIYKFRTMRCDAEDRLEALEGQNESDGLLFKMRYDPRVTAVGRWLRRFSLDELPQLLNILRGDMSLVGPRPPLPKEVEAYDGDVRRRLLVKPGLTGLWQISGRSDLPWQEAVRLDLFYVENWSPTLDLVILFRTVKAIVSGRGAY